MTESTFAPIPDVAAECPCGHPRANHDAIATRYCEATTAGALPRDCICSATPADARSYDRR